VASSDAVEGGSLLHDAISANILRLADATNEDTFPYEANSIEIVPLDEFNDGNCDSIGELEAFKSIAMSSAEIDERTRTNYRRAVSIKWPSLLPDANGASDILCISWKGLCGQVPGPGIVRWKEAFGVALVSVKDSVVYYFKKKYYGTKSYNNLTEPPNRVIFELKRIKEIYNRTSRPSQ
jgi:hypothetical protein